MKFVFPSLVILTLGLGLAACSSDTPTTPSSASIERFSATLLPANEIPAIADTEARGSAVATITFNLTKDSSGNTTAASFDFTVTATGFPNGTALTKAHIHAGSASANGGVFVNAGIADGEIVFASGGGTFSKTALPLTVDQANAILANPGGFYFNIHTARNPDGVARGQLIRVQ